MLLPLLSLLFDGRRCTHGLTVSLRLSASLSSFSHGVNTASRSAIIQVRSNTFPCQVVHGYSTLVSRIRETHGTRLRQHSRTRLELDFRSIVLHHKHVTVYSSPGSLEKKYSRCRFRTLVASWPAPNRRGCSFCGSVCYSALHGPPERLFPSEIETFFVFGMEASPGVDRRALRAFGDL